MYILACETLGFESKSVVLSAGLLWFDLNRSGSSSMIYDEFVNNVRFVKFNIRTQIERYNRIIDKETLKYWDSHSEEAKVNNFIPNKELDRPVVSGIEYLREYIRDDSLVASRGFLSKFCLESLCRDAKIPVLFKHNRYAETSTLLNCIKADCTNGWCEVPNFDKGLLNTNSLAHKIAYDALQIVGCV